MISDLKNILDSYPGGVFLVNKNYEIGYINPAIEKDFGPVNDSLCYAYFHELKGPCPWCKNSEVFTGKTITWEWYSKKNNRTYTLFDVPLEHEKGIVSKLVFINDITEYKKTGRESEEKFRNLFNNAEVGMFISRLDGSEIIDMNDKYLEIFGRSRDEMVGYAGVIHWADQSEREELVRKLSEYGRVTDMECKMLNKQGEVRNCFTSVKLYKDTGILEGSIIDITKLKQAEEKQKKLEEQLLQSQKMDAIGKLAGGIAHDFNNLLTVILGYSDLLCNRLPLDGPEQKAAVNIKKVTRRAAELTAQLLGFARQGKHMIRPLNLHKTIDDMIIIFSQTLDKKIKIITSLSAVNPIIKGDQGQIQQVLMNLALNSRDAMNDGGTLAFETEEVWLDEKFCSSFCNVSTYGRYILLKISDTGIGIPKENVCRIFEPFFTTKEIGKGSGMGLAMVYGIITNHGGIINVESEAGHGTTFNIYLPVCMEKVEENALSGQQGKEDIFTRTATVMVVDDEEVIREILETILKGLGPKIEVVHAANGVEAVSIYKEKQSSIDLVLLDLLMPEMNGEECFKKLKEINPQVKVVISTGYELDGKAESIMTEGANAFIQKPYEAKELSDILRKVLK